MSTIIDANHGSIVFAVNIRHGPNSTPGLVNIANLTIRNGNAAFEGGRAGGSGLVPPASTSP
jgi:hypothetical protein